MDKESESKSEVRKETGTGENVKGESEQPQHQQSRHHERAIIKAIVVIVAVVIIGFLMAKYVENALNSKQGDNSEMRSYNGFEFANVGNSWFTQWESDGVTYNLEFRHPPWDVENITVLGKVDARFQRPHRFITHDPTDEKSRSTAFVALAAADLTTMLGGIFETEVAPVCTANITEACLNKPVVTCSTNASVIYLKVSNETGIFLDGNCAVIQGYEEGLTKAADKAIYQWLGIIR